MSYFTSMLSLRDTLGDLAVRNNEFVKLSLDEGSDDNYSGQLVGCIANYSSESGTLTITGPNSGDSIELADDEIGSNLDLIIPGTSISIGDYMTSFSRSGDLYSSLATITSKFSYSSRITLSDINTTIDNSIQKVSTIDYDYVDDLKQQLLILSNDDGYITGKCWTIALQQWMKNSEDTARSGSAELDATNPFSLAGLYSLILNGIQTVLSSILSILQGVFRAIGTIIGAIVNFIITAFQNYIDDGCSIDFDAPNMFIRGPVMFSEINRTHGNGINFPNYDHDYRIHYSESMGIGSFQWWNDDFSKLKENWYLYPHFSGDHASLIMARLSAQDAIMWNISHPIIKVVDPTALQFRTDLVQTESDVAWIQASGKNVYASLCIDAFMRSLMNMSDMDAMYANLISRGYIPLNTTGVCFVGKNISGSSINSLSKMIVFGTQMVWNHMKGYDTYYNLTFSNVQTAVHDFISELYSIGDSLETRINSLVSSTYHPEDVYDYLDMTYGDERYMVPRPKFSLVAGDNLATIPNVVSIYYNDSDSSYSYRYTNTTNDIESNCLPISFGVKLNSITNDALLVFALTTAAVSTAAAFVYCTVAKAMRLKKIGKQALRTNKIEEAKTAWLGDGTEEHPGDPSNKELAKAYEKEVDRFNRLGRMFGWGSYDAANGWVNAPENASSAASPLDTTLNIGERIKTLSSNSAGTISYTLGDVINLLTEIRNLIR